ncbi:MAG: DUF58 domain-containing protein [Vulcanimicrobiota bacterium]
MKSRFHMPGPLKKFFRLLRRLWGFVPVSIPGLILVTTIGLGTYYLGSKQNDHVIFITGAALLGAAALDALIVLLTSLFLAYSFHKQSREHLAQGYRLEMMTDIEIPSARTLPRFLPPLVEASTHILNPPDFDCQWKRNPDKRRQEWLVSSKRCLLEENFRLVRRIIVKDVLGFSRIDWEQEEPVSLVVTPKPLPLKAQSVLRARFTGDDIPDPRGEPKGDRVDMRQYTPGDPPRLLLWKVYARTGKLMVRMPENAITTAPRICAYLVAGEGDEVLASLARTIVDGNLLGQGWRFGADGSDKSVEHREQALRLIARSGNPGVVTGLGLSTFLNHAHNEGFGSCLVLVPPIEGEWVEKVAASISRSPLSITLLTVGSVSQLEQEPKWHRWVFYEEVRKTDPSELLSRLNSSTVTDWLTYEPETSRLIPLRVGAQGAVPT